MKKGIWFIVIGLLLLAIDIRIPFGTPYRSMLIYEEFGLVFQTKVIEHFIGTRPYIDLISDLLGYLSIFIGSFMLLRKGKRFIIALCLIPVAVAFYIGIPMLPYQMEGTDLYLKVAGYQFLYVFVQILIEFCVVYGIVYITNCRQNAWHNNELMGGWIVAMCSKVLLVLIVFFFGRNPMFIIYSAINIGATVFYINRLFKTFEYDPKGELV